MRPRRETIRMTVDLTPDLHSMLSSLEMRTYLGSKATILRHALVVFESLVSIVEQRGSVTIQMPSGESRNIDRVTLAVGGGVKRCDTT